MNEAVKTLDAGSGAGGIAVTLPDGKQRRFPGPVTGADIAASIGPGLAKAALAIVIDGEPRDLATRIDRDARIAIVTGTSPEALEILRHDAAHVMAEAVKELYPETQVTFGPATDTGFYYDFARDTPFTPDDLARIEQRMHEIVDRNETVTPNSSTPSARNTKPSGFTKFRRTRRSRSIARASSSISAPGRICPRPASSATPSS